MLLRRHDKKNCMKWSTLGYNEYKLTKNIRMPGNKALQSQIQLCTAAVELGARRGGAKCALPPIVIFSLMYFCSYKRMKYLF